MSILVWDNEKRKVATELAGYLQRFNKLEQIKETFQYNRGSNYVCFRPLNGARTANALIDQAKITFLLTLYRHPYSKEFCSNDVDGKARHRLVCEFAERLEKEANIEWVDPEDKRPQVPICIYATAY
jgi:hypothetical protein